MAVVRSVVAECDKPCPEMLAIPPNSTQPWLFLTDHGWSLDYGNFNGEIGTICPKHTEEARS